MKKVILLVFTLLFLAGCETYQSREDDFFSDVDSEIEQLRQQGRQDMGLGNIRVEIDKLSVESSQSRYIDAALRYGDTDRVTVSNPSVFSSSGLIISVLNSNAAARLRAAFESSRSAEKTNMFIVVADGSSGYIYVGREIPVRRFYYAGRWFSGVEYDFRSAGRSFEVTAGKLPSGMIRLRLMPVFSNFLDDGGSLELTELSTEVQVRPGEQVAIGSMNTGQSNAASAILGYSADRQSEKNIITVTAYLN